MFQSNDVTFDVQNAFDETPRPFFKCFGAWPANNQAVDVLRSMHFQKQNGMQETFFKHCSSPCATQGHFQTAQM